MKREIIKSSRRAFFKGEQFGCLTVIVNDDERVMIKNTSCILCHCSLCGQTKPISTKYLRRQGVKLKACGCSPRGSFKKGNKLSTTHGKSGTRIFHNWSNMLQRCYNENYKNFLDYGGRGIKVCERWCDFTNFLEDMGEPPTEKHSIDRIDVNGDYCPENCQWATVFEQANNKRNNKRVTFNGKTQTVAQWGRELGISRKNIARRLNDGWSVEEALTSPKRINQHK